MTTTIESAFGSHLWAAGFLLNNQLTDFSWLAQEDGKADGILIANRVQGGKRPRSSMAPLIVFAPDGRPRWLIGTGSPAAHATAETAARTSAAMAKRSVR